MTETNQQPEVQDTSDSGVAAVPLPPPPALPFTMHANLAEYRRRLGVWRFVLAFVLTFIFLVRFGFVVWVVSTVLLAVLIAAIMYLLSRRTITATPEGIEYVNGFGIKKSVAYSDIKDSKVFVNYLEPGFGVTSRVIIGHIAGKPFVSINGLYWKLEDVDLLLSALSEKKVSFEYYADIALSAVVAKQFPQSVSPIERHPYMFGFGIAILIMIAIAAGVFIFMDF